MIADLKQKNNIRLLHESRRYNPGKINSYRFQNKILKKIKNKTIIELLYSRLKLSKKINKIIFAIPKDPKEKKLKNLLIKIEQITLRDLKITF